MSDKINTGMRGQRFIAPLADENDPRAFITSGNLTPADPDTYTAWILDGELPTIPTDAEITKAVNER